MTSRSPGNASLTAARRAAAYRAASVSPVAPGARGAQSSAMNARSSSVAVTRPWCHAGATGYAGCVPAARRAQSEAGSVGGEQGEDGLLDGRLAPLGAAVPGGVDRDGGAGLVEVDDPGVDVGALGDG